MLSMTFTITPTELQLSATDEHGNTGTATMPYEYQKANTPQEDNIRRQLTKSGGTIYNIAHLQINAQVETPFIPSSHLTTLRRQCLEEVKGGQWKKEEGRKFNWKKGGKVMEETNLHPSSINLHPNKPSPITHHPSSITSPHWGRPGGGIMHSRYCLRHELGYCTKSGRKAPWREPLTLHLADGKSFNIKFDCKQCEMYIMR
jgi:putative protease